MFVLSFNKKKQAKGKMATPQIYLAFTKTRFSIIFPDFYERILPKN